MNQLYNVTDIYRINPLEAASAIISMATIKEIRQLEDVSIHGYTILDRWAMYQPKALLDLEADGELVLFHHLLKQQDKELAVLDNADYANNEKHLTTAEHLVLHEIDTKLVRDF